MKLILTLLCCMCAASATAQGRQPRASVTLLASTERVVLLETEGAPGPCEACTPTASPIEVAAAPSGLQGKKLSYSYTVTGGKILGKGAQVKWDLSGVKPGAYTVRVKVRDGRGRSVTGSKAVTVEVCTCIREAFPPQGPP